jgi:chromosome segregation ATPase
MREVKEELLEVSEARDALEDQVSTQQLEIDHLRSLAKSHGTAAQEAQTMSQRLREMEQRTAAEVCFQAGTQPPCAACVTHCTLVTQDPADVLAQLQC